MLTTKRIPLFSKLKKLSVRYFSSKTLETDRIQPEIIKRELYLENQVVRLVLNNQKNRNALSSEMLELLYKEISEIDTIQKVRAIILASEGSVFSSGHDLKELA